MNQPTPQLIDILLVEDDESDVVLTKKALSKGKLYNSLSVVSDGEQALRFLRQQGEYQNAPRPDLILLDLNMPNMDGRETLKELQADDNLKRIPVVVLTTSDAELDVIQSYDMQVSCYITKPVGLQQFSKVVHAIQDLWLAVVKYPQKP